MTNIIDKIQSLAGKKIGILGAGAWGSALAVYFASKDYQVFLWCHEDEIFEIIKKKQPNPFLPEAVFSDKIFITQELKDVFENAMIIFCTAPTVYLHQTVLQCTSFFQQNYHVFISTARGVDLTTNKFPHQIIEDVFGQQELQVFFHGFNKAKCLIDGSFSSGVLASNISSVALYLQQQFSSNNFRLITTTDIVGSVVCASFRSIFFWILKNMEGSNISENFQNYFLTKYLEEIGELIRVMKGSPESLILLMGNISSALGGKKPITDRGRVFYAEIDNSSNLIQNLNLSLDAVVPEDVASLISMINLAESVGIKLPLCQQFKNLWLSGNEISFINKIAQMSL